MAGPEAGTDGRTDCLTPGRGADRARIQPMPGSVSWNARLVLTPLLAGLIGVACGGNGTPKPPDTGGGTGPDAPQTGEPITGAERLGWRQAGANAASYSYKLYVDNVGVALTSATCGQSVAEEHDCSSLLPPMSAGRHVLELTATTGSQESARSQPLAVLLSSPAVLAPLNSLSAGASGVERRDPVRAPSVVCSEDRAACYSADVLAVDVKRARSLSPVPDGRVFLISGDTDVVALEPDGRVEPVGVESPCRAPEIPYLADIAVSSSFFADRVVFGAWVCEEPAERKALVVVSYREFGNVLGQARAFPLMDVASRSVRIAEGSPARLYLAAARESSSGIYELELANAAVMSSSAERVVRLLASDAIAGSPSGVFFVEEDAVKWIPSGSGGRGLVLLSADEVRSAAGSVISLASNPSPGGQETIWVTGERVTQRVRVARRAPGAAPRVVGTIQLNLRSWGRIADLAAGFRSDLYALMQQDLPLSHRSLVVHLRAR